MFGVDNPGKIGGMDAVVDHRSGYAKTSGTHFFAAQVRLGLPGKLLHQKIKLRKPLAGEALPVDYLELPVVFGEQGQIALGTANITGENHGTSRQTLLLNRFNKMPVKIASFSLRDLRHPHRVPAMGCTTAALRARAVGPLRAGPRSPMRIAVRSRFSPRSKRPG